MSNVPPCATCTHRVPPLPPSSCPEQLAGFGPAAPSGCAESHAMYRLRLDTLEEIEACGSRLIRQAGHLNKLLALPDSLDGRSFDRQSVKQELHRLDQLLVDGTTDERGACLDRLRAALGIPSLPHRQPAGPRSQAPAADHCPGRASAPPHTTAIDPPEESGANSPNPDWRKNP